MGGGEEGEEVRRGGGRRRRRRRWKEEETGGEGGEREEEEEEKEGLYALSPFIRHSPPPSQNLTCLLTRCPYLPTPVPRPLSGQIESLVVRVPV